MTDKPRPTLHAGWTMPEPPVEKAIPTYFLDGTECHLEWSDPETGDPATQDIRSEIVWPFGEDDFATRKDLEGLGFQDREEVPPT